MKRAPGRLLLFLVVAVAAIAGWSAPAFAHAQLQSTEPAAGTVLAMSPRTVVLHFGEDVEVELGAVRVFDASSKRVDTGNSFHPHGDGRAVAVNVPGDLPAGGYVVTWRVISADSHPVHGAFTFLIGSGGAATTATAASAQAARLLAATGGSAPVGVLFGIIRFASFTSLFLLVGGAAFLAGLWPEGRGDRRAQGLVRAGLAGAVVATALAVAIQGPYGAGLPVVKMFSPAVIGGVLHTRFGEVNLARLLLLAGAAGLVRRLFQPGPLSATWRLAAAATGCALLLTFGLAGHAAAGSLVALAVPFDLVHVAAVAVWIGGLAMLCVTVLARRDAEGTPSPFATVLPRYSQWALAAVVAIAVSGGFAAWRQVGSISAVTTTTFGRLVLAKSVIFVVLVGVATCSRRLVHGRLAVASGGPGPTRPRPNHPRPGQPQPDPGRGLGDPLGPAAGAAVQLSPGPGAMATPPAKRPAWNTRVAPPRPPRRRSGGQRRSDLRKAVLAEVLLAVAIVAVAAVLVNAQPARQALNQPFSAEVHAGPNVLVDVVIDPAKAGPVAIHLYTLRSDGSQIDAPDVTATMSLPAAGIANRTVPLQRGGPGHFLVSGFPVPLRGTWTLRMTVRTAEFGEFTTAPIAVPMR